MVGMYLSPKVGGSPLRRHLFSLPLPVSLLGMLSYVPGITLLIRNVGDQAAIHGGPALLHITRFTVGQ